MAEASTGDLTHLTLWIGDAAVVGLGESKHGTHTLHRLAHRLFQHLVENQGFEVYALEIDQAHAAILDRYVQGDYDDLDHLIAGGWWGQKIFYDEALKELLRWMRQYNQTAERPLHFSGYDAKQPLLAAESLVEAIERVDSEAAKKTQSFLSQALALGSFGMFPNVSGYTGTLRTTLPKADADTLARVDMMVGGESVDFGSVGFFVRAGAGKPLVLRDIPLEDLRPVGSTFSIELEVPATAGTLELSLFHRGNGTVWFEHPNVLLGDQRRKVSGFETVEVRPLMMPALQPMDYRADLVNDTTTGRDRLRITAHRLLDKSLEAARSAQRHVEAVLRTVDLDDLSRPEADWVRQLSRLVTQAVEWRALAEPNRDVFLAENLLWLHRTAFPGRRILALGHTSHTERRPRRMGAYVAATLGDAYRTVSMLAGSGSYRYFGDVRTITDNAPLELFEIQPERWSVLEAAVGKLHSGSFLVRFPEGLDTARAPNSAMTDPYRPDVMIFIRGVEPLVRSP